MKKIMIVFLLIVVGLTATVILQNRSFFASTHSLHVNLWVWEHHTSEFSIGVFCLALFLAGLLLAYFSGLSQRYKSGKTVKRMETSLRSTMEMVTTLKNELQSLKGGASAAAKSETPSPDPTPDKASERPADADQPPPQSPDPADSPSDAQTDNPKNPGSSGS